jgi:hypothetical protein
VNLDPTITVAACQTEDLPLDVCPNTAEAPDTKNMKDERAAPDNSIARSTNPINFFFMSHIPLVFLFFFFANCYYSELKNMLNHRVFLCNTCTDGLFLGLVPGKRELRVCLGHTQGYLLLFDNSIMATSFRTM